LFVSLKKSDDRPRILWRCSLKESEEFSECKMKDTPVELFICTQVDQCKFDCLQKIDQLQRSKYVKEQQNKMMEKIDNIRITNGNNNRNRV
jgi:hypothetical protein